jgi:hypothetical protein
VTNINKVRLGRKFTLTPFIPSTVIANDIEAQGIKFDLRNLDHRIMLGEGVVRERNNAN